MKGAAAAGGRLQNWRQLANPNFSTAVAAFNIVAGATDNNAPIRRYERPFMRRRITQG